MSRCARNRQATSAVSTPGTGAHATTATDMTRRTTARGAHRGRARGASSPTSSRASGAEQAPSRPADVAGVEPADVAGVEPADVAGVEPADGVEPSTCCLQVARRVCLWDLLQHFRVTTDPAASSPASDHAGNECQMSCQMPALIVACTAATSQEARCSHGWRTSVQGERPGPGHRMSGPLPGLSTRPA
jgi:hypothetical protein